jgi:hypothetical protein
MHALRACSLALLLACVAAGQTPRKITGPSELKIDKGDWSEEVELSGADVEDLRYVITGQKLRAIRVWSPDAKTVRLVLGGKIDETGYLTVATAKGGKVHELYVVKVVVGTGAPTPGPAPPGPAPGPTPPQPPQPPQPNKADPFGTPGFKVLIILEKTQQHELPASQIAIAFGRDTEQYVAAKGGSLAVLDKDDPAKALPKAWQDAMKRPRTSLPWVLIGNGVTGYEGPLPTHEEEWKLKLKEFGGQ